LKSSLVSFETFHVLYFMCMCLTDGENLENSLKNRKKW
jgi:hypothetical protein